MITAIIDWVLALTAGLGYFGVGILMAIESSFLPLPSEIVIPPAAYLASQGEMNIFLVILTGVVGSVIGAAFNYFLSLTLGRPVIYRLAATRAARFIFITPEKIQQSEEYFLKNSRSATFFGRLIPVVRHLISIPAGFCRMPFGQFVFFTAIGSLIWVSVLAALGYFIGANKELLTEYYREVYWALAVFGALYLIHKIRQYRRKKSA